MDDRELEQLHGELAHDIAINAHSLIVRVKNLTRYESVDKLQVMFDTGIGTSPSTLETWDKLVDLLVQWEERVIDG